MFIRHDMKSWESDLSRRFISHSVIDFSLCVRMCVGVRGRLCMLDSTIFHCRTNATGVPTLIVEMAGGAAEDVELDDDDTVLHCVMQKLRRMFRWFGVPSSSSTASTSTTAAAVAVTTPTTAARAPTSTVPKVAVPAPLTYCVTRWGSDPYANGTGTYVPVGSTGNHYDSMARCVAGKLFWAGDATNRLDPLSLEGVRCIPLSPIRGCFSFCFSTVMQTVVLCDGRR